MNDNMTTSISELKIFGDFLHVVITSNYAPEDRASDGLPVVESAVATVILQGGEWEDLTIKEIERLAMIRFRKIIDEIQSAKN